MDAQQGYRNECDFHVKSVFQKRSAWFSSKISLLHLDQTIGQFSYALGFFPTKLHAKGRSSTHGKNNHTNPNITGGHIKHPSQSQNTENVVYQAVYLQLPGAPKSILLRIKIVSI